MPPSAPTSETENTPGVVTIATGMPRPTKAIRRAEPDRGRLVMLLCSGTAFLCGVALLLLGSHQAGAVNFAVAFVEGCFWFTSRRRPTWTLGLAHGCLGLALIAIGCTSIFGQFYGFSLSFFVAGMPLLAGLLIGRTTVFVWTALSLAALVVIECADLFWFGNHDGHLLRFLLVAIFVGSSTGTALVLDNVAMRQTESLELRENAVRNLLLGLASKNRELADARDAALDASRAKGEFLAAMSHEIRTPLNAVIGLTGVLLDTPLNEEQKEYAATIRSSGNTLLTLINDILDFSKIEAGKVDLENAPFDIVDCVEDALELVSIPAAEKHLRLAYFIESDVPARVLGDPGRVRQVLLNLVSNAVKFTERGRVTVRVSAAKAASAGKVSLHVAVTDTGIGITPEQLNLLFEPFTQADASTTSKFGGTGLGLAISRRLATRMEGSTWAESTFGQGSTFHFTFTAAIEEGAAESPSTGQTARVVVADREQRNALMAQLKRLGIHGQGYATLDELKRALKSSDDVASEVVLVDHALLEGGVDIRDAQVRALVVLTPPLGHRISPEITKAQRLLHLATPVRRHQLAEILAGCFSTGTSLSASDEYLCPTSSRKLRILIAEDNPVNQRVARLLVERDGHRADVVGNGAEAVRETLQRHYDVILMDMRMPEMDGTTATRRIRDALPKERRPYIIALTANASSADRDACLEAGMDAFLTKPIAVQELRQALAAAEPGTAKTENTTESSPAAEFDPHKLEELAMLSGNDPETISSIIDEFLQSATDQLTTMKTAVETKDAAALARAAHTLKGSSGQLGALGIMRTSYEVEVAGSGAHFDAAREHLVVMETQMLSARQEIDRWLETHNLPTARAV